MKKLVLALGIPKGYLIAEETIDMRGKSLEEQDVMFAAALPFVQTAYLEGIHKILTLISFYVGADLDSLKITVEIAQPHRINARYIEQYEKTLGLVQQSLAFFREIDPDYKLSLSDLKVMLSRAGVDPEIFNVPSLIKKHKPDEGEDSLGNNPLSSLGSEGGQLGSDSFGSEEPDFNASDIGVQPNIGESLSRNLNKKLNYYVALNESLKVHSKIYNCFVKSI